ncbi:hypothetical protein [Actinomadura rugatobispora]|uniref:Uncharacterized protein n=1 Tax=Actinomadura rugatobispora TaxID=1994 RepID=A0ABW1A4I3_9ACTN|nr:hypothetical protein GCM10010200_062610 [Actinomadura rugatobispora]
MTTTAEQAAPTEAPESEERAFEALMFAALAARREQRSESIIEHPLLLAALMRRREGRGESGIEHPLLLAALAGR